MATTREHASELPHVSASTRALLAFAAPVVVGALLRLPHLSDSFYGDEAFSVTRDSLRLYTDTEDRFRPLYFTLLYLWRQLGFSSEVGLRSLGLLFGLAQIPLAWLIGRRLGRSGSKPVLAPVFAWFVALSPLLIEFSQELRMYSLVALLSLAMAHLALRVVERPSAARFAGLVVVGTAGVYTHLHFFFSLAGLLVYLLMERRSVKPAATLGAFACMTLLYAPNLGNLATFIAARSGKYPVHLASAFPKLVAAFVVGFNYFSLGEQEDATRKVDLADVVHNGALVLLASAVGLVLVVGLVRAVRARSDRRALLLASCLGLFPVLLGVIASYVTKQAFAHPKYLVFGAPFASLALAIGWVSLERPALRWGSAAGALMVLAIALAHFWDPQHHGRREDWRGVARTIQTQGGAAEASAVVELSIPYVLLRYYAPDVVPRAIVVREPGEGESDLALKSRLASTLAGKRDVFYVWYEVMRNERDPADRTRTALASICGDPERTDYNPRLRLYTFHCAP